MALDFTAKKTAERIARVVADYFKVSVADLIAPRGTRYASSPKFHQPRRLAMFFMRKEGMSFPQIGEFFNRDHTTVIQSCRNAEDDDAGLIVDLQRAIEASSVENTNLILSDHMSSRRPACTNPNCQRMQLELAELKLQILELRLRLGCG
jgi:hypothetical protein